MKVIKVVLKTLLKLDYELHDQRTFGAALQRELLLDHNIKVDTYRHIHQPIEATFSEIWPDAFAGR